MSRRTPGAESATGLRAGRDRWSATLGGARDAQDAGGPDAGGPDAGARDAGGQGGRLGGLLELPAAPGPHDLPRSARLRSRTGFRAAVLLGVLAVLLGGWFWWHTATSSPEVLPLSETSPAATGRAGAADPAVTGATATGRDQSPADSSTTVPGRIIVHVAGAVANPGVIELPAGSRLHEAIAAAGGSTDAADPQKLNLASVLEDGQKIVVPTRGEPDPAEPVSGATAGPAGPGGSPGTRGGKINLNSASVEELGTLPRVGPVLAQRIVDWRKQHGRFKTVQELDAVDGVGPKMLEALLPLVSV